MILKCAGNFNQWKWAAHFYKLGRIKQARESLELISLDGIKETTTTTTTTKKKKRLILCIPQPYYIYKSKQHHPYEHINTFARVDQ